MSASRRSELYHLNGSYWVARETLGKNFPLPNSDRRLMRAKQSFNRLEKRCREGQKTAAKADVQVNRFRSDYGKKQDEGLFNKVDFGKKGLYLSYTLTDSKFLSGE